MLDQALRRADSAPANRSRFALAGFFALALFFALGMAGAARAQAIPGFVLVDTVMVPVDGSSVSSAVSLDVGVGYRVRASGTLTIGADGTLADAEYADFSAPADNTVTGNVDLGIGIDDPVRDGDKLPEWGAYDASHVYTVEWIGAGSPISLDYHDSFYGDNAGSLTVEIFAPAPAPGVPGLGGLGATALVAALAALGRALASRQS